MCWWWNSKLSRRKKKEWSPRHWVVTVRSFQDNCFVAIHLCFLCSKEVLSGLFINIKLCTKFSNSEFSVTFYFFVGFVCKKQNNVSDEWILLQRNNLIRNHDCIIIIISKIIRICKKLINTFKRILDFALHILSIQN